MQVSDLRVMGRATQGVRLINIKENDSIAAVTKVIREEEVIVETEEGETVLNVEAISNPEISEDIAEHADDAETEENED